MATPAPAIDGASIIVLPKFIAFKGENGQYLKAYSDESRYMTYTTSDSMVQYVPNEVIPGPDGSVRIRNVYYDKLWRASTEPWNWIVVDSNLDSTSSDTLFQPVKVTHNIIALRSVSNNMFCKRLTAGLISGLSASDPEIDVYARMAVEEPIVERAIDHVKFRLVDAKIYGQEIITLKTELLTNRTTEPSTLSTNMTHTDARTSTWNSSVSLKLGWVNMTMRAVVPLIVGKEVRISGEIHKKYQWGEAVTTDVDVGSEFSATVPPMSQLKVTLLATRGHCDVPFSYVQRDTLTNGDVVTSEMDNGIYTGTNSFKFRYETKQLPLPL